MTSVLKMKSVLVCLISKNNYDRIYKKVSEKDPVG